jgi:hypothetical protein
MPNMKRTVILALATTTTLSLSTAPVALADEFSCSGTVGRITVDNLRVPDGRTCTLNGTRVEGNIKVEENAVVYARGVRVEDNVQAENAALVSVTDESTVGGSIQIKQGGGATIVSVKVDGDIQFDDNTRPLRASGNRVGGNIQVVENTGGVRIDDNTVDGNLQCKENRPAPTGGNNIVKGSKEDQCRRL